MRRYYSRLATIEERKNVRKAVIFIFLSITAVIALIFLGLPLTVKFVGFVSDFKKAGTPISKNDTTPPAPPRFENLPSYTNNDSLEISGKTEDGALVTLNFNGNTQEIVADKEGNFSFNFFLSKGENIIFAFAKDASGNQSTESEHVLVTLDKEKPDISIEYPQEGANFFGEKQKSLIIKGQTDPEASLTINDRLVGITNDGKFSFNLNLSQGQNTFNFKAVDKAENLTEKTLTVNFIP